MSLIKINNRFPWGNSNLWDAETLFFDDYFTKESNLPAMNVKENPKNYEIELSVPGFSKKEIEVSIENDLLKIHAEKSDEQEDIAGNLTRKEFSYDSLDRSVQLPANIDSNAKINATCKDGVLQLVLPKQKTDKEALKKVIDVS